MATSFWGFGRTLWGDEWKLPSYIDFAYPELVPKDTRSAQEIIDDILKGLTA